MRQIEKQQKTIEVDETIAVFCDCCKKEITLPENKKSYNYFTISTYRRDYSDDEGDFEQWDACSVECALKLAEEYLKIAHERGNDAYTRTRELTIALATSLHDSHGEHYNKNIAEAAK